MVPRCLRNSGAWAQAEGRRQRHLAAWNIRLTARALVINSAVVVYKEPLIWGSSYRIQQSWILPCHGKLETCNLRLFAQCNGITLFLISLTLQLAED